MVSNSVKIPKCEACQYGKQERNPKYGTRQSKYKEIEVELKINQLKHGELIFSDQYESRLPGRVFGNRRSKITSQVYKGVTIICDEASIKISVHHQVSFTVEDTIMSKLKFDREATSAGFPVKRY